MALIGTMKYLTIGNNTYEIDNGDLPIASASTLGGIKVGSGLTIDSTTGTLSATGTSITIDNAMSDSSVNPVQNKVIKQYVDTNIPNNIVYNIEYDTTNHKLKKNINGTESDVVSVATLKTDMGFGAAADKAVDSSISAGSSSTNLPTSAAVASFVEGKGYITTYTDEKMKWVATTTSNTYYPIQSSSTADTNTGNTLNSVSFYQYYNTAGGYRRLILGNGTSWKSSGGAYGTVRLYGAAATYYGDLVPGVLGTTSGDGHLTANRTWTFPDKTGTVALTSDIPTVPTNVSAFNNDAGYLTSYTETDPTVPSWAKASSKPTYTAVEVGALPDTTVIPTITDTYSGTSSDGMSGKAVKSAIDALDGSITGTAGNGKTLTSFSQSNGIVSATFGNISITKSQISDFPTIPSKTSELTNDSGFITSDVNVTSTVVTAATTNYITGSTSSSTATGGLSKHASAAIYTTADSGTSGYTQLRLGNTTATSSAGGKEGQIRLYGTNATYYVNVKAGAIASSNKTITLPNKTGTVALTSDIPDTSGFITSETDPVFSASAAAGITSANITSWNAKVDAVPTNFIQATAPASGMIENSLWFGTVT